MILATTQDASGTILATNPDGFFGLTGMILATYQDATGTILATTFKIFFLA